MINIFLDYLVKYLDPKYMTETDFNLHCRLKIQNFSILLISETLDIPMTSTSLFIII